MEWCRELANNESRRISYGIGAPANYENDYSYAKTLLKLVISEIQSRMSHLDDYYAKDIDYVSSIRNRITFN